MLKLLVIPFMIKDVFSFTLVKGNAKYVMKSTLNMKMIIMSNHLLCSPAMAVVRNRENL